MPKDYIGLTFIARNNLSING